MWQAITRNFEENFFAPSIYTRWEDCFLGPFMLKTLEMATWLQPSMAKPRRGHAVCTLWVHPPPPHVPPFLLTQNLSPKDIARRDIMKLNVSWRVLQSLVGKGLMLMDSGSVNTGTYSHLKHWLLWVLLWGVDHWHQHFQGVFEGWVEMLRCFQLWYDQV